MLPLPSKDKKSADSVRLKDRCKLWTTTVFHSQKIGQVRAPKWEPIVNNQCMVYKFNVICATKRGSKFVQIKLTIIMFCHASVGLKEPLILILLKQQDNRKSWMCWGAGNFGHISTHFLPLSSLNEPLNRMTAVDKKKTVLYTPPTVLKWLSY